MAKKSDKPAEVTVAEAAEILGLTKARVNQILADGSGRLAVLRVVTMGRLSVRLLDRAAVEAFAKLDRPRGNYSGKPRTGKARPK